MPGEVLHIHKNRINRKINLILLLIPPIVFAIIVAAASSAYQRQLSNSNSGVFVIGGEP
jgi:hypothetical protein